MLPDVGSLMGYLRRLAPPAEGDTDSVLLMRFADGDETAFAALFRRHAALVWGVCQRALPMAHDAEDAFQAVFVVLARKAGALRRSDPLEPWLHRVAWRTAQKARTRRARVEAIEEQSYATDPAAGLIHREQRGLIDEEIDRLPNRYRQPVLLCLVEGMTNEQAARRIGCPVGTVQSRLSRARDRLRQALQRRGIDSPAVLGALVGQSVPARLLESPLPSVATSATVSALAKGVLITMTLDRFKFAFVLLVLTVVGTGAWFGTRPGAPLVAQGVRPDVVEKEKKPDVKPPDPPKPPEVKKADEKRVAVVERPLADNLLQIREALDARVEYSGVDAKETKLGEELERLQKIHRIQFIVNERAFDSDILDSRISDRVPIAPMRTSVANVLKMVLGRAGKAPGAMYLVRKDSIEITSERAVRAELGLPAAKPNEQLLPLISDCFDRVSLKQAFGRMAESSGYNVILDPRAEKDDAGKSTLPLITQDLHNVPIDVAVELIAEMAGLEVVRRANVFFVTTNEIAEKMRRSAPDRGGIATPRATPPPPG